MFLTNFKYLVSFFKFIFTIWAKQANLSRSNYKKLLEVLRYATPDELASLPLKLDTLYTSFETEMPLLPVLKRKIPVHPNQQPTRRSRSSVESFHYWYDLDALFYAILTSDLANQKMHFGMAEYVDEATELWHQNCWGSSIRTVSGDFAYDSQNNVLFPGDFVQFPLIHSSDHNCPIEFGRIIFIGRDRRSSSSMRDMVVLKVQAVVQSDTVLPRIQISFVLLEDIVLEIPVNLINCRVKMHMGYTVSYTASQMRGSQQIDWVFNKKLGRQRTVIHTHPLRAELEVEQYGREYLCSLAQSADECRSCPILLFIDGFGVHRNNYRSLKAFYATPASLPYTERRKLSNTFTLTLGPHGASMDDTVSSFESQLRGLERGVVFKVNHQNVLMNVFVLAYTGDMPQQAANSGFLSHQGHIGCRICYCPGDQRHDLDYDVIENGRFHYDVQQKRQEGDAIEQITARKRFWKSNGLLPEPSVLEHLTPALDLVLSRSCDIPHSEWKGLSRILQDLLFDVILTPRGRTGYESAFRTFIYPSSWPCIQNPESHRGSWSLTENGLALILTSLVLRCNATESWFEPTYLEQAERTLDFLHLDNPTISGYHLVIHGYAVFAATVSAVSAFSYQSSSSLHTAVLRGRKVFQQLVQAACCGQHDSKQYRTWNPKLSLPNIHIGLHFADFVAEYGPLMNCNVLTGELKHK